MRDDPAATAAGAAAAAADVRRLDADLARHDVADEAEAEAVARVRAFLAASPAPFDRRTLPGHLTGSAFVVDDAGRLLLHHHRRLGLWLQLGGHADGETDAAAVAWREAGEESGLVDLAFDRRLVGADGRPRPLDVDVHGIPPSGDMPAHLHFDVRYLLTTRDPGAARHAESESHGLEWVELAEARRRCDAGIGRAVAKIARLLAGGAAP